MSNKFLDKLNEFKGVIVFITFVIGSYVGMIVHIEKAVAEETAAMRAQTALIHDDIYLTSRIRHNEIEMELYELEIENLEEYLGDEEPSPREARKLEYLKEELARLKADSEAAREILREKISHLDEHDE